MRKADNLTTFMCLFSKSPGSLNLLVARKNSSIISVAFYSVMEYYLFTFQSDAGIVFGSKYVTLKQILCVILRVWKQV